MAGPVTRPAAGPAAGADRAWGWVAHLRAGGTTPWAEWLEPGAERGRVVPGAQQLELLRRLNLAGQPTPGLADRVLTASAPGRGLLDLELVGAVPESPFGPRPVDPSDLPTQELLRVATGLIAEDLVARGTPPAPRPLPRPWRREYRLLGDPLVADTVRRDLVARGRPPGGARPTSLVLGAPLDLMLADTWTRLSFEQGAMAWPDWLRFWHHRNQLPPRVDLVAVAAASAERSRPGRVRIVLDHAALPGLLGVRRVPPVRRPGADAVELGRRVATVLGLLVPPARREQLLGRTLWPRLADVGGRPVAVPEEQREWLARRAARMARQLRRAGYPVVGDLAGLAPRADRRQETRSGPSEDGVLDLAVAMLLEADSGQVAGRAKEHG